MPVKFDSRTRGAAIGATAVVIVLGGFLLLQDQRHGWPFSRHHVAAAASVPRPTSAARVAIELPADKLDALGIQLEPVRLETLADQGRAVATVVADESRISHVHTRVAGWVEQLFINTTGETVRAGQPLAAVFSQELYSSQNEYLATLRQAQDGPASATLEAARTRLKVLGMGEAEIAQIERSGEARRLITLFAPRAGVVLQRGVSVGTAVDPGTDLITIADLTRVWVLAEASEAVAARLKPGATATLSFPSAGRAAFQAPIDFIYPTLTERTRTVRVRFTIANTDGTLRPGVYGTADFATAPRKALTVARDAVVYTGDSQHVFVRTPQGVIEPRSVTIGDRVGERIEVIAGVAAGEEVVTTGVFLIDSESRLRASGSAGHSGHGAPAPTDAPADAEPATPPAEHQGHDGPR